MKIVLYTAIVGDYDRLLPLPPQESPDCGRLECVAFGDESASGWTRLPAEDRYDHPRLSAKWYRMHPRVLFPDADVTIWIDGSLQIVSSRFVCDMAAGLVRSDIAVMAHPARNDIWSEGTFSLTMSKYQGQKIEAQMAHYRKEGYRADNGLYCTGLLVRKSTSAMDAFNSEWMKENLAWSYQDQVSFPYLLWKHAIVPDVLPVALYSNPYFHLNLSHRLRTGRERT